MKFCPLIALLFCNALGGFSACGQVGISSPTNASKADGDIVNTLGSIEPLSITKTELTDKELIRLFSQPRFAVYEINKLEAWRIFGRVVRPDNVEELIQRLDAYGDPETKNARAILLHYSSTSMDQRSLDQLKEILNSGSAPITRRGPFAKWFAANVNRSFLRKSLSLELLTALARNKHWAARANVDYLLELDRTDPMLKRAPSGDTEQVLANIRAEAERFAKSYQFRDAGLDTFLDDFNSALEVDAVSNYVEAVCSATNYLSTQTTDELVQQGYWPALECRIADLPRDQLPLNHQLLRDFATHPDLDATAKGLAALFLMVAAEKKGDQEKPGIRCRELLRESIGQGNYHAGITLGHWYNEHDNQDEALEAFSIAANHDWPEAHRHIASIHMDRDENELAFKHYSSAFLLGDHDAAVSLGYLLEKGKGVTRNTGAAADYYKHADERGIPEGTENLGCWYHNWDRNYPAAIKCFERAANLYSDASRMNKVRAVNARIDQARRALRQSEEDREFAESMEVHEAVKRAMHRRFGPRG